MDGYAQERRIGCFRWDCPMLRVSISYEGGNVQARELAEMIWNSIPRHKKEEKEE